ncbi:hypothetical protein ABZ895_34555, partial [Streptomyces californicus]|uniref:hypothetical protein n=1 Tax=Streptomyces californicus TaxID=67351 RepID=UPI0033D7D7CD
MAKPTEGYYKVRSHYRRKPRPSAKKLSGWSIAGLIAVVWLWSQLIGFGEASPTTPQTPTPSVSASATPVSGLALGLTLTHRLEQTHARGHR